MNKTFKFVGLLGCSMGFIFSPQESVWLALLVFSGFLLLFGALEDISK